MGEGRLAETTAGRILRPSGFELIGQHRPDRSGSIRSHLFRDSSDIWFADRPDARLDVSRFNLPRVSIGRVFSTGHAVDIEDPDAFTLLVPFNGHLFTEVRETELKASAGAALLLPPEKRRTRSEIGRSETFLSHVFVIPRQLVADELAQIGLSRRTATMTGMGASVLTQPTGPAADLVTLATLLSRDIERQARSVQSSSGQRSWERLLVDKLIDLVLAEDLTTLNAPPKSRPALVAMVLGYMHDHLAQIDSIAEIADALGISRRAIELAFRTELQLSPARVLMDLRLDAMHRLIAQRPHDSITSLALSCGITHFGRFSQHFRRRFGMLPSDLRRSH